MGLSTFLGLRGGGLIKVTRKFAELGVDMDLYGGYDISVEAQVTAINGYPTVDLLGDLPAGSMLGGQILEIAVSVQGKQEIVRFHPY